MTSALERLAGPSGPLAPEPPDEKEIAGLLKSGKARLRDAKKQYARAGKPLRSCLQRSARPVLGCLAPLRLPRKHRFIVFQVLPHTLGLGPEVWRVLDKCHDIRNVAEYEGTLDVGERLVTDLVAACGAVVRAMDLLE